MQSSDAPGWTPLPLPSPGAGPSQPTVGILSLPSTSATPSAGARPSTGRNAPRKRLPQEAYELLTDYYDNVNQYPQRSECIMLADRIRKMPGCDDYTPDKVKQYFGTKRYTKGNTRARTGTKPSGQPRDVKPQVAQHQAFVNSAHILYPSLASEPSILSKLDILLSETPDPTPNVAQIWASRLAVVAADIITYAELRRAQTQPAKRRVAPTFRTSSQLPTPESSTSPEPLSSPVSPVFESSWGRAELEEEDVKDQLLSDSEDDRTTPVTPTRPRTQPETIPDARLTLIAEELNKALSTPPVPQSPRGHAPRTFKDLSKWFEGHETPTSFLESLGKPQLRLNSDNASHKFSPTVGSRSPS